MPLFKKVNNTDKAVEAAGQPNSDEFKTPQQPPKHIANNLNPSASTVGHQQSPCTSKDLTEDWQEQNAESSSLSQYKSAVSRQAKRRPKYIFYCQLAHGSPTCALQGFTDLKELYAMISECFKINVKEILFCTLNTYKVDMDKLLVGQIALDDFIYAHVKGHRSEMIILKRETSLGLTITDNGVGLSFIKRIKEDSIADRAAGIDVGDHIEWINGINVVGAPHADVARKLREIPVDDYITLGLVKPFGALKLRYTS